MVDVLKKLKRLRVRSFDELRVRGAQSLAAYAERRGLSEQARVPSDAELFKALDLSRAGGVRSAESLLSHFRTRARPRFFAGLDDRETTVATLRQRFGVRAEKLAIERARRITEGRFDLLGLRDLNFNDPPDWHLEPISGKRSPLVHWSRIDYLDAGVAGDKKITWELNRHQYFMVLGRAYWYTGDERFAHTFTAHLEDWMERNPPKLGINWASSLEVSFRAMAWLWGLHFFKDSPRLTPALFLRALKFLYLHGRHLETYLSTYFSPNTHLTGEALGLFYLGTLLPEFRCAGRWRETGRRVLMTALDRHVRPDGVYFEQASYYHRYTTDFYTHLLILSETNGQPVEEKLMAKLAALLDHLMYITRPDGTTPFFGDDDGGRLVMLDERPANDFRAALATGAALFARPDYKHVAGEAAEETLWLLGAAGLKKFDHVKAHPPAHESRAFPDGGYYVMRDGWTSESNYLLIDCGPHGTLNCGHAHADALAIEVAARGRTLLVDPGTYTYTGSSEMRDWFRSSAAHNTLVIDGESSSTPAGPFAWSHIARAVLRVWTSRERFDYFEGAHDGYARLQMPAAHTRAILFLKGDYWVMRDRIETAGAHRCELRFHFVPEARPAINADAASGPARERAEGATGLDLFTFNRGGSWRAVEGWVSRCYAERAPAPVLVFSREAKGATEFVTFLMPRRASEQAAKAREMNAVGGRAFEVRDADHLDLLLISDGRTVETERIASDFAWTWMRFNRDHELIELVAVNGRRLALDGQAIVDAAERAGYLVARRAGDQLLIETDAQEFTTETRRHREKAMI